MLDQKYLLQNTSGVVELISPVVKQKREGKGIPWRGTYYGEDINFKNIPILHNGDDIEFYMQDSDFKGQILNKERTFGIGDNMRIVFDISGELKGGVLMNRSIYLKEVKSYNEDIIPHKMKLSNKQEAPDKNQASLF